MAGRPGRRSFGSTRKRQSGKWQAFYADPDGRTQVSSSGKVTPLRHNAPATFDTREDAEAWLTDERRLISAGTWTPPARRAELKRQNPLTVGEYAEVWLATRKVKGKPLAANTRDGYRDLLDRFILPTWADVPLADVTATGIDNWYERVAINTPTYRARAYSLLRTILGTAVQRRLLEVNPAHVRGGGNVKAAHDVRPATLEELAHMVAATSEKRRMMLQLAAWCGLRFGEITELRRKDIDMKANFIRVKRGVVWVKDPETGKTVPIVKEPKTEAGIRPVPIPPHLAKDLAAHILEHAAPGDDGLLFATSTGRHISPSGFYGKVTTFDRDGQVVTKGYGWYAARQAAGRDDLHFHDLRHTSLTRAAVAGATTAELMALAGHTTPGAAMRYQHAAEDRMQELAKKMSALAVLEGDANV